MRNAKPLVWLGSAALAILFLWGFSEIVMASLETGDVYPPYSSLRADPLGAKALYESLSEIDGLMTSRLYKPRTTLAAGTSLLVLGVDPHSWHEITQKTVTEYEKLVSKGGRLILAFVPVHKPRKDDEMPVIKDRWHLQLAYADDPDRGSPEIPRDSALYFIAGDEWKPTAFDDNVPLAIERSFGQGSIVLVAQSYSLSNEGLRENHDAELIAKLIGPSTRVVFDENHFGIEETGSVTTLMRKYHLEAAVGVLVLGALLFLWRSSSSLLPPRRTGTLQALEGRDAQEGMVSLLERSVTEQDLLNVCFSEWSRTAAGHRRASQAKSVLEADPKRKSVDTYRAVREALTQK
jgi:hypothetical protein